MNPVLSHIPAPMLDEASDAQISPEQLADAWAKYVAWHCKTRGQQADYRLNDWRRQLEFAKRDAVERVPTTQESIRAAREFDDADRKRREAATYAAAATTFRSWCSALIRDAHRGKELTAHERLVAEWASTHPSGGIIDFGAWACWRVEPKAEGGGT